MTGDGASGASEQTAGARRREEPETPQLPAVYLYPGQIFLSVEPCTVTTVLGSCVAVCLWDSSRGVGGMNHFLMPIPASPGEASARFGAQATEMLLDKIASQGCRTETLQAKLFGGSCVLNATRRNGDHLGARNVAVARRLLAERAIPIAAEDVGGTAGRKLIFRTHDGAAWVRRLR